MDIEEFVAGWEVDPAGMKKVFIELKNALEEMNDTTIEFHARPGITYSMRGVKTGQDAYPVFVLVDVIDDDPSDRWLSVCFYGETITDPDELGDTVPGGLLGRDGHCFDVEDADMKEYLVGRMKEAHGNQ